MFFSKIEPRSVKLMKNARNSINILGSKTEKFYSDLMFYCELKKKHLCNFST